MHAVSLAGARAHAASHLLPRVGDDVELGPVAHVHAKDGGGGVADGEALPVVGDPVRVWHLPTGKTRSEGGEGGGEGERE
eukprot:4093375-Pleurochrysis_carterae.AAC.2